MTQFETYYHVTPYHNVASIVQNGVLVRFGRGKRPVTYWCDETGLLWALAHISARYATPVSSLAICKSKIDTALMVRTKWKGIYTLARDCEVDSVVSAKNWLEE